MIWVHDQGIPRLGSVTLWIDGINGHHVFPQMATEFLACPAGQRHHVLPDVASITRTYSPSVTMTLEHDIGGAKCGIQAVRIRISTWSRPFES